MNWFSINTNFEYQFRRMNKYSDGLSEKIDETNKIWARKNDVLFLEGNSDTSWNLHSNISIRTLINWIMPESFWKNILIFIQLNVNFQTKEWFFTHNDSPHDR